MDPKPDGKSKIFIYKQTGGFIGVNRKYEKDLAEISSSDRQKLEKLIADSGLLSDKSEKKLTAGSADMYQYDFQIKEGGKEHHVTFDDGTLPKSYKPLVQFLRDKMVDQPRR